MLTAEEFLDCVPKELSIEEQLKNLKITPEMIEQARKNGGQLPMMPGRLDNTTNQSITPEMIKALEAREKKKKKKSLKEQALDKRRSKIANKSKRQNRKK